MESTALAILLVALIHAHSGPMAAKPNGHMELTHGRDGKIVLSARLREQPPLRSRRVEAVGLRGEYRDGKLVWLERGQDGQMQGGAGLKMAF